MRWQILDKSRTKNKKHRTEEIINILLENRHFKTKKEQREFLDPKNPYRLRTKDVGIDSRQMSKALARIKKAIKNQEKIIIYGDYDTDGVCATAVLWETLHQLKARVMPFIPTREEGYGLKVARVEEMAQDGVKLIITVDQGIVAYAAAEKARKLGIDLIITDHHVFGEKKPKALAIIHTTKLAGTGVAWFLARQLIEKTSLDLVTISTITDIVPLIGANRSLVKFGLTDVRKTKRPGLISLYQKASIKPELIGPYEIGFMIGPRLNSAGRLDDPLEALRLVCTSDKKRALDLADRLQKSNRRRQELLEETFIHARSLWLKTDGKSKLILISHQTYQEGIVGLVAARLMEEFYRPVVVIAQGEKSSKASARSIEEFNIIEAVRACADIIGAHGGHKRAAGFSIKTTKIEILRQRLISLAEEKLKEVELSPTLKIDTEADLEDLDLKLYQELSKLAPFGEGNPTPVFCTRGVKVVSARLIGKESKHLKLSVVGSKSKVRFEAIGFGMGSLYSQLAADQPIDIAYNLILNEWNGNKKLELKLKDIRA